MLTASFVLLLASGSLVSSEAQSADQLKIVTVSPHNTVSPGELIVVHVSGLGPLDDDAASRVELSIWEGVNEKPLRVRLSGMSRVRTGTGAGDMGYAFYAFLPFDLPQGKASLVISAFSERSDPYGIDVTAQPRAPVVLPVRAVMVASAYEIAPQVNGRDTEPGITLEKGRTARLVVLPLVDPDDTNSSVLITLRQGNSLLEFPGEIVLWEASGQLVAPAQYQVTFEVPQALKIGMAEMEVRLRLRRHTSDPARVAVRILDSKMPGDDPLHARPEITRVSPTTVGMGQLITVVVRHQRSLQPDPLKTTVLLSAASRVQTLHPEMNSAEEAAALGEDAEVLMLVRLPEGLTGTAHVQVLNPARGEVAGLSTAWPLEISSEITPPEIISVDESTFDHFNQITGGILAATGEFGEYLRIQIADCRCLTIQAQDLDYNPEYISVAIEQGNQRFTLTRDDFITAMGGIVIVRIPRAIRKGPVIVTVANRSGTQLSRSAAFMVDLKQ